MSAPFLKVTYNYDNYSQLTGINVNGQPEITYELNKDNQRIAAAPANAGAWRYQYDNLGQLTGAVRKDGDIELNNMSYNYDMIGNRLESSEDGDEKTYAANLLNQYTAIGEEEPTYDRNGNMLTNRGWTYAWNTENRLIKAEKDDLRLEFDYDYKGRRAFKKVYENEVLTKHQNFIYDNFKLVAICNALNNNTQTHTFFWQPESVGLDIPLCMIFGEETYFYVADGNKNVTGIFDETGTRIVTYTYGPFGQTLSMTGPLAEANPFRFSSEFHDDETGLVYYNYRYYDFILGRWSKRDPISIGGGVNEYAFANNNPINYIDDLGLDFIAVADRAVKRTATIFYHYSLQKWKCCKNFTPLNEKKGFSEEKIRQVCNDSADKKLAGIELLASGGWKAKYKLISSVYPDEVEMDTSVSISVIIQGDTSDKIMPIKNGSSQEIDALWNKIIQNAQSYKFAEHATGSLSDFEKSPTFKNWPESIYNMTGTNSNTFVRHMVALEGLPWTEMGGFHPGDITPSSNVPTNRNYFGKPTRR